LHGQPTVAIHVLPIGAVGFLPPTDDSDSRPTNGSRRISTANLGPSDLGHPSLPMGHLYINPPLEMGSSFVQCVPQVEPCQIIARAPTGENGFKRYDVNILFIEISPCSSLSLLLFCRHPASRMGSAPHPARLCSRHIAVRMGSASYLKRQAWWMYCHTCDGERSPSCTPL
jgi:hypothetical protein